MAAIPLSGIGRSDPAGRDKQTWRPDPAKRDCSPEIRHCAEVAAQRVVGKADLPPCGMGKADDWWEETGKRTTRPTGVGDQASKEGFAADNVGKVLTTSSGWTQLQRPTSECKSEGGGRRQDWHMRS